MDQILSYSNGPIKGSMDLPFSKSLANRALLIRAISGSDFRIDNLPDADDTKILQECLENDSFEINSGDAGTAYRFLLSYFSLVPGKRILTGSARMLKRPVGPLVEALRSIGAQISYLGEEGFPPLMIEGGHLKGGAVRIEGNVSSQFISSLLMIAPALEHGLHLHIEGAQVSRPYIDMSIGLMRYFGIEINDSGDTIEIMNQEYAKEDYLVEKDWSAASYPYAICYNGGLNSEITLPGLYLYSLQGDSVLAQWAERLGIRSFNDPEGVRIVNTGIVTEWEEASFSDCPDLVPAFAVMIAASGKPFHFKDIEHLRIKESDRIQALDQELGKIGASLKADGSDYILIPAMRLLQDDCLSFDTYSDHRMAMSFACLVPILKNIQIRHTEVVTKSFPGFWDQLKRLGISLKESVS